MTPHGFDKTSAKAEIAAKELLSELFLLEVGMFNVEDEID